MEVEPEWEDTREEVDKTEKERFEADAQATITLGG